MCLCFCDFFLVIIAVFFPPIPVWIRRGFCSADSIINIALCCLGYIPGLLHSWWVISQYPESYIEYDYIDEEAQTYRGRPQVVCNHPPQPHPQPHYNHSSNYVQSPVVRPKPQQPQYTAPIIQNQPTTSYGSINQDNEPSGPPPTYNEVIQEQDKRLGLA